MAQQENGRHQGSKNNDQDQGRSGGDRSNAGSNYGDWRPESQAKGQDEERNAGQGRQGGDGSQGSKGSGGSSSGATPSTAPSGIGSKPNK